MHNFVGWYRSNFKVVLDKHNKAMHDARAGVTSAMDLGTVQPKLDKLVDDLEVYRAKMAAFIDQVSAYGWYHYAHSLNTTKNVTCFAMLAQRRNQAVCR